MYKKSKPAPRPVPGRVVPHHSDKSSRTDAAKDTHKMHRASAEQVNGYGEHFAAESNYDTQKYYTVSNKSPKLKHRHTKKTSTPSKSVSNFADGRALQARDGVVLNMKQKLAHNIEHYSNLFQEITFPIIFKQRARSSSRNRKKSGCGKPENNNSDWMISDREDEYPSIENIELYQFDGFVFVSERESGQGHTFQPLQLVAPTWCDRCGDFIWGAYKQCLRCQS